MVKIVSLLVLVLVAVGLSQVYGAARIEPEIHYFCPDDWCKFERTCYNPVKAAPSCINSIATARAVCRPKNATVHTVSTKHQDNSAEYFVSGKVNDAIKKGQKNIYIGINDAVRPNILASKGGSGVLTFVQNYLEGYLTGFLSSIGLSSVTCATPRVKRTGRPEPKEIPTVPCLVDVDEAKKTLSCRRDPVKTGEEVSVLCERPSIPVCEEGWSELNHICYKTFSSATPAKPVTHDEAEAACVKQQAHLVSIHSQAQQEFITQLMGDSSKTFTDKKNRGQYYFWSGMKLEWKDDSKLVKFEWTDKSPVDFNSPKDKKGNKPWDGKNPDNEYEGEKTCVLLYGNEITIGGSSEFAGEWQDAPCDNSGNSKLLPILAVRSYVCQKPGRKGTCIGASPNPTDSTLVAKKLGSS